jgi:antitoxin (DNA-binding transcriptional repressor) of toxin-antitoxin stability system
MAAIDIHEARTHLSRLVYQAAKRESFTLAKAGKPTVRVVALDAPVASKIRRLRFMAVQIDVPEDFDCMVAAEIAKLFGC